MANSGRRITVAYPGPAPSRPGTRTAGQSATRWWRNPAHGATLLPGLAHADASPFWVNLPRLARSRRQRSRRYRVNPKPAPRVRARARLHVAARVHP